MGTATAALEPSSREPTVRPASMLTRKSVRGESDYLLEFLADSWGPTNCSCPEYILSGPEFPCLKRRIAELQGIPYEPMSQMHKCTCGGAWGKQFGEDGEWLEEEEDYPPEETSDANSDSEDSEDSDINADPESHPAEPTKQSYKNGGDPEVGDIIGVDSEAISWKEHGGWKGNLKGCCDGCIEEEHSSEPMHCGEHGGRAGNPKRLCDACKEVYGDPFLVRIVLWL